MKRIAFLVLLAMVVTMTSVANSFIPEKHVQAEEVEVSSAKPVIVPYLDVTIDEVRSRKGDQKHVTNRLVKRELQGVETTEQVVERTDIDDSGITSEFGTGSSEIRSGTDGLTYLGEWVITAYCACPICCGEWSSGYTASGVLATGYHTIACNSLPFGTQVVIDGIIYTVEDTGWSPYGDAWIDIFFDSHAEALAYGMQTKDVYLLGA